MSAHKARDLWLGVLGRADGLIAGLALALAVIISCTVPVMADDRAERIVAIGDLHGDYAAYEAVMRRAGLMDEAGAWAGGNAILVQTGDIAGRGPDSLQIMRSLMALQLDAEASGGRVLVLVGNHEAMQMTGDLRYVHPGEWAAFVDDNSERRRDAYFEENRTAIAAAYREDAPDLSDEDVRARFDERVPLGFVEHRSAWAPDGELGAWVASNPALAVLDDTLFVHGGLSRLYAGFAVDEINTAVEAALLAQTRDRSAVVNDPFGPAWYRGLLREADAKPIHMSAHGAVSVDDEVAAVREAFQVARIVVGHTPQIDGIALFHEAQVIVIDTGMASHYGGVSAFLEITPSGIIADNNGAPSLVEAF